MKRIAIGVSRIFIIIFLICPRISFFRRLQEIYGLAQKLPIVAILSTVLILKGMFFLVRILCFISP